MTLRWRTRRESESSMVTGRARSARGLANSWLRIRWWRNIRLRPRSTVGKPSPSWNCKDRKGKIENRKWKLENGPTSELCVESDVGSAALLYSPRSESQFTTRCLDERFQESNVVLKKNTRNRPVGNGHRRNSDHPCWNSDHGECAGASVQEDDHSRGPHAQRAHRRVESEPGDRD